jgi:hypothetical protein
MIRYFFIFVLTVMSLSPAIRAEEVIIPITSKVSGNDDPKEKNTWEQDNRSITNFPTVTMNGNTIYIYSNILLDNLQITIIDEMKNIIYSNNATITNNHPYSFTTTYIKNKKYIIEMTYKTIVFYGIFQY